MRGGKRPGAGRKPSPDPAEVRWPVRWTKEEQRRVREAAESRGITPTEFIKEAAMEKCNWEFFESESVSAQANENARRREACGCRRCKTSAPNPYYATRFMK